MPWKCKTCGRIVSLVAGSCVCGAPARISSVIGDDPTYFGFEKIEEPGRVCKVPNCPNKSDQGEFVGQYCSPCHDDYEKFTARFSKLNRDERRILGLLMDRIELGRKQYGPWNVQDGRNYRREALDEVLDGLLYSAAGLVKEGKV